MAGPVLVVGATGILAPAVAALVGAGHGVVAVARTAADLASLVARHGDAVRPLAADASSESFPAQVSDAVGGEPVAGALLYGPAVTPGVVAAVAGLVVGAVVHVQTSAAAAPDARPDELPAGVRRLVLGWRTTREWHTAGEVSAAALELLEDQSATSRVLGVVRPWEERPA